MRTREQQIRATPNPLLYGKGSHKPPKEHLLAKKAVSINHVMHLFTELHLIYPWWGLVLFFNLCIWSAQISTPVQVHIVINSFK